MGVTCKPVGKQKSIMKKLQNQMEKEQKLNVLAKKGDVDKKSQLEKN